MGNYIDTLGQTLGTAAGGGILGMIMGGINDDRQYNQQERLQALQIKGQKEMTDYGYAKQLQMWMDTNYKEQVNQLKKAGLNPALLYGMGGGGGTTTGSGMGNVTGGHAPVGGGEIMGLGIQMPLMQAQIEKTKAETENIKTDTIKKGGVDTKEAETRIQSLTQGIQNAKVQKELSEIQVELGQVENHIKGATQNAAIAMVMQTLRESYERLQIIKNDKTISDSTLTDKIKIVRQELIGIALRNELTSAQTKGTLKGLQVSDAQITTWATQLSQAASNLDRQERELALQTWEAQMKTAQPSVWNVIGGAAKRILDKFDKIEKDVFGKELIDKPYSETPPQTKKQ